MLATLASLLHLPTPAQANAPYCVATETLRLDFGTVSSTSQKDVHTTLVIDCTGSTSNLITPATFRVCLFIGEGTPNGVAPRRMTDGNGTYMLYDLYSDSSRTKLIGPLGSSHPTHSFTFNLAPREMRQFSIPIYGRVHAGQNLSAISAYRGTPYNSTARYSYGFMFTPSESECRDGTPGNLGGKGGASFNWSGVEARMANTCRIATATDLDFGTAGGLTTALEQTSVIKVKCSTNATWHVTLNNGANAVAGSRFMASGSARIGYELYRDAGHTQRWGNTIATGVSGTSADQNLTVYGRIPALSDTASGSYRDVITVTMTY